MIASSGRHVAVPPERLERWVGGWDALHGRASTAVGPESMTLVGEDGASAVCRIPFPPLAAPDGGTPALIEHALRERTVAVLLCRRGGHAVGIFRGRVLLASKVGSRLVHGRSAAGGWSQHRFERRRVNQSRAAWAKAASEMAGVLEGWAGGFDAVVVGGDQEALRWLAGVPALAPYLARAESRRLALPTPRQAILEMAPDHFRAVDIAIDDGRSGAAG